MPPEEKGKLGQAIKQEFEEFLVYTVFLSFFFCSLTIYSRLLLKEFSISYFHYGYGIFEAAILAKIIVIGKHLRLVEKFAGRPLIIPTLYKSVVFSFLVLAFSILEHFLVKRLHGIDFRQAFQELTSESIYLILAKVFITFIVFILFFGLLELGNELGENKLYRLFMHRDREK